MDDKKLEGLAALGEADLGSALERVCGDAELYWECLGDLFADDDLTALKKELEAGNVQQAFSVAHALKGVISNLGLTALYRQICEIVEPLRAGKTEGVEDALNLFIEQMEQYRNYYNSMN